VTVLHRETVGPDEALTLRSTSGDALTGWLLQNGYLIPPDIAPVIQAYVAEGADFIALRLRPQTGVTQMKPVRVVTPGVSGDDDSLEVPIVSLLTSAGDADPGGVAFSVGGGYDWWTSDFWTVGISGRVLVAVLSEDETGSSQGVTSIMPSVLLTIGYH
jgi:hypothetical protein